MSAEICVIGIGAIGSAIARRLAQNNKLALCDHMYQRALALGDEIHAYAYAENKEAIKGCKYIILAVKPHDLEKCAEEIRPHLVEGQTILSVLAGVSIKRQKQLLGDQPLIRMMPNTACAYGHGVIALSGDDTVSEGLKVAVEMMLKELGYLFWIPEERMNAATALIGSGPAFVLLVVEAMIEAGVALGFKSEEAQRLIAEMAQGTLAMLEKSCIHPAELKWQITSPGGTTVAGLVAMEQERVRYGIIHGFQAARARADEMLLATSTSS